MEPEGSIPRLQEPATCPYPPIYAKRCRHCVKQKYTLQYSQEPAAGLQGSTSQF
jgi:hypothetical protein